MMRDQMNQALGCINRPKKESAVERMKACTGEIRRVTDVMEYRSRF
ncbi:hypothetical protein BXY51_001050 [Actinoplanes cyaneus]|nr:hypothetical protein [Actinoplanes cyaneus]